MTQPQDATTEESAMPERSIPEPLSKEIFLALVEAQDGGTSVAESRSIIAGRFGVSELEVQRIEQEGLEGEWPPLG
jgi:hypothetical protein